MISIDGNCDRPGESDSDLPLDSHPQRKNQPSGLTWTPLECFAEIKNPWLILKGERWRDDQQREFDYWRVEKADSLIVLPQQDDRLLLPHPIFRPGVGRATWDFPGGRLKNLARMEDTLVAILNRELALPADSISKILLLNPGGWSVNSSFSNQKLYGYWVSVDPNYAINPKVIGAQFQVPQQLPDLLSILDCLQCRSLLREWQQRNELVDGHS
ncbi:MULTISPECIES: hypothetical protein [unclassified Synechocystis]|uniref:hypothetical protein n=1 Tax=unclassified Synechocystis TaxID=2640012 RepID=UPI00040A49B2|nr:MULTISPECIES: hypothetical protein [unclassified Synechocystis]AIE75383.1 hypothetical protein D082_28550 [Synechocystis sp. PCC 6714]MCT0253614.1 hypothetical protein [Synechocystis sp. CS-94]